MYDPAIGRFLQREPVAGALTSPLSVNRFSYAHNNPINLVDPSGFAAKGAVSRILEGLKGVLAGVESAAERARDCSDHRDPLKSLACPNPLGRLVTGGVSVFTGGDFEFTGAAKGSTAEMTGARRSGRAKNKLSPAPGATGAHSVFRRDPSTGKVSHYETFSPQSNPKDPYPWKSDLRFDRAGDGHFNKVTQQRVPNPHVHDPQALGGVRAARPDEIP